MADDAGTWSLIHAERGRLADMIEGLTPEQWNTPSLCAGWTVGQLAAHILGGAEQTPGNFMLGMLRAGFRFDSMIDREMGERSGLSQQEVAERLRQRTSTTNKPPAPATAMLGEVVVHGEDLRRPIGIEREVAPQAVNECLDMYTKANFPVGGKKRIAGLALKTTDTDWSWGTGPEVSGPALSLVLAMTGRRAGLAELSGEGVATITERMPASAAAR
jgi:uncharacterized protein (TIGR03083 family)